MKTAKTALITGASSGIGYEMAKLLAADGYHVAVVARSASKLDALAAELGRDKVTVIAADLSQPGAAAAIHAQLPAVEVLVNNAGIGDFGAFAEVDLDKSLAMMQLNMASVVALARLYLPTMVANRSGKVLNVASTAAFQPGPLMAVYYATKSFVLSFSEAISEELRGSGVTVTALCPGPTASGFQAGAEMEASKLVRGKKLPTSADVAKYAIKAMNAGKVVAVHGLRNRFMAQTPRYAPRFVVRRLVKSMQSAH
jgi:uncharacterized protein